MTIVNYDLAQKIRTPSQIQDSAEQTAVFRSLIDRGCRHPDPRDRHRGAGRGVHWSPVAARRGKEKMLAHGGGWRSFCESWARRWV